jgi:hypothetical protein
LPTQAELDATLADAWKVLRGDPKKMPSIRLDKMSAEGQFRSWEGQFGAVLVTDTGRTRGATINTVFHEAIHARLRQIFPVLSEHLTKNPSARLALRHLDEIVAYAFGGYGRLTRGPMVADRLWGVLETLLSPWSAYGSATNPWEAIPGLIRDAALLTLYVYYLVRIAESAQTDPQHGLPAPAATTP